MGRFIHKYQLFFISIANRYSVKNVVVLYFGSDNIIYNTK